MIVEIAGLRRTGKTFLFLQLIDELLETNQTPFSIWYFTFDEEKIKLDDLLAEFTKQTQVDFKKERLYIFLDEIQKLDNFQSQLKIYYDLYPNIKFFISGSTSLFVRKKVQESLAGRIVSFFLPPLHFEEYLRFKEKEEIMLKPMAFAREVETEFEIFLKSQFIETVFISDPEEKKQYFISIMKKIIFEDIPQIFPVENPEILWQITKSIGQHPGMIINLQSFSRDLGISAKTLSRYFFYLEESFLIKKVYNFSRNLLTSEKKLKRYYLASPSFAFALTDFIEMSRLAENFVVSLKEYRFFWRDAYKHEVDFVDVENGAIVPIEVKYKNNPEKKDMDNIILFAKKFHAAKLILLNKDLKAEQIKIKNMIIEKNRYILKDKIILHCDLCYRAVYKIMKILKPININKTILLAFLMLLFLPLAASAYSFKKGDSVYVGKDEVIQGNLYAVGSNLTVEGKVTGDIICAGQSINIMGEVAGDVICAGESVNVSGPVGGNLRLAGSSVNLNGRVARNAMLLGANIITAASSTVGWDLLVLGNAFELNGNIGRDLYGNAAKVSLSGQIGQDVDLKLSSRNGYAQPLIITGAAKINGQLKYKSAKDAAIDSKAVIKGEVIHNFPTAVSEKSKLTDLGWWLKRLISLFSALVIGLVLISLWREPVIKITDLMLDKTGLALGWGILALFLTPLIAVILLIAIIGIPLSLILLALYLIAIYLGKILAGILVGRSLLNNFWPGQKDSLILAMIIGIVIAYLIFALPLIGWVMSLLASLWGLGGIMLKLKK